MSFKTKRLVLVITVGILLIAGSLAPITLAWASTPASDAASPVEKGEKDHHRKHATQQEAAAQIAAHALAPTTPAVNVSAKSEKKNEDNAIDLISHKASIAATPKDDPKGTQPIEYAANDRPRRNLGAVESQRVDELSGKAAWHNKEKFRIHDLFHLPDWVSLSLEDRLRYEDYSTPWRGNYPSKTSDIGQEALVNQLVVWSEARFSDKFRAGFEFWDARSWNGPNSQTNKGGTTTTQSYVENLNASTVNTGQFAQIYVAYIEHDLFGLGDSETKAGQMTMDIGSRRLIGRAAFRNTQRQYVGFQERFREKKGDWELTAFATIPELFEPGTPTPSLPSGSAQTLATQSNNIVWNRPETNSYFTGALFQKTIVGDNRSDLALYYLNEGPQNILNRRLFTPSIRLYKPNRKGEINYELETIGQTGSSVVKTSNANTAATLYGGTSSSPSGYLPSQHISGVYQHIHFGYTFDTDFDPRLTAQWDYGSSHFDTLYGPTVFEFGPTGIVGFFSSRTNINSPGWKFEFIPHRDITLYINQRWWWLADACSNSGWTSAGIYNTCSTPLTNHGSNYQGSYVGETIELNARWDAHSNIAFQLGWQVLMKGNLASYGTGAVGSNYIGTSTGTNYLSTSSGTGFGYNNSNVNYFYTQMQIRF